MVRFQASWKEQAIPNSEWGQAYAEGKAFAQALMLKIVTAMMQGNGRKL